MAIKQLGVKGLTGLTLKNWNGKWGSTAKHSDWTSNTLDSANKIGHIINTHMFILNPRASNQIWLENHEVLANCPEFWCFFVVAKDVFLVIIVQCHEIVDEGSNDISYIYSNDIWYTYLTNIVDEIVVIFQWYTYTTMSICFWTWYTHVTHSWHTHTCFIHVTM